MEPIYWPSFFFLLFAAIACAFAVAVFVTPNIVRMAFYLVMSLAGTAGLFFVAGADFVGSMQLLIYVGGTLVLLVFGVMLTSQDRFISMKTSQSEMMIAGLVGACLLAVLTWAAVSIPEWRAQELQPYDYLTCANRWPERHRYHLYPRRLKERLPRISVPLVEPDPDVPLDLQAVLEQVYAEGRYMRRIRYEEPCVPPLATEDQAWANERWTAYQAAHPEWFPPAPQQ